MGTACALPSTSWPRFTCTQASLPAYSGTTHSHAVKDSQGHGALVRREQSCAQRSQPAEGAARARERALAMKVEKSGLGATVAASSGTR